MIILIFLDLIILAAIFSHTQSDYQKAIQKPKIIKKKKGETKLTQDEQRNLEILDQIKRYDGTNILRKE